MRWPADWRCGAGGAVAAGGGHRSAAASAAGQSCGGRRGHREASAGSVREAAMTGGRRFYGGGAPASPPCIAVSFEKLTWSSTVQVSLVFPQIWGGSGSGSDGHGSSPAASSCRPLLRHLAGVAGATAPCFADGSDRPRAACLLLGSISAGPALHASSSAPSRPAPSRLPGARRPPAPPPPPHRPPPRLLQPARLDEYMDAFNEASVDISGDGLVDEVQDVGRADSSMSVGCARRRGPSQ
ncbi:unnamed protein product [Urochloa humidicola]